MIFRIDRQTLHGMLALLTLLLLAGCADSGSGDEPVLARLSIEGDSLMFTETGVTRSLQARGYDNNGNEMDVAVTWQSSRSDQVHIDASSGVVTSIANGAAVITATADGVESNPLTAVVTTLQSSVQAISDDAIVQGPIAAANAPDTYGVGYPFTVILDQSISLPQVGDLLAANGNTPFAGRVTAISQDTQGNRLVTLEIVAINEIFADFNMDEEINLAHAPVTINPQLEEYFVVDQKANGEVLLTPRQQSLRTYAVPESAAGKAAKPLGTVANPYYPYKCSYSPSSAADLLPIKIDLGNQTSTIKQDLSLPLIISPTRGVEKAALRGEISLSRKFKFAVTAAFEAKVTCMMEVYQIDIPLPGALGFLVGVQVPIGIGGELSAKIKVADVGVEPEVVVKATAEAGYYNPPACDSAPSPDPVPDPGTTDRPAVSNTAARTANKEGVCGFDISFDLDTDFKLNFDRPTTGNSLDTLANDVTLEPRAMVFGYAILGFGNKYFSVFSTEFLELRVGPYLSANLATANGQIVNDGYQSSYGLGGEGVLKPGSTVAAAMKLLGGTLNAANVQIKLDQPWSTSPKAKSLTLFRADSNYQQGDELEFDIELDETTIDPFPVPGLFYNVADILIYKKAPDGSGEAAKLIASMPAEEGQLKFTLKWIADADGDARDQFFAFVSTKLLPTQQIGVLELGKFVVTNGKIKFNLGWVNLDISCPREGGLSGCASITGQHYVEMTTIDEVNASKTSVTGGSLTLDVSPHITNSGAQAVFSLDVSVTGFWVNEITYGYEGDWGNIFNGFQFRVDKAVICEITYNADEFINGPGYDLVTPSGNIQNNGGANDTVNTLQGNQVILQPDQINGISFRPRLSNLDQQAGSFSGQGSIELRCDANIE